MGIAYLVKGSLGAFGPYKFLSALNRSELASETINLPIFRSLSLQVPDWTDEFDVAMKTADPSASRAHWRLGIVACIYLKLEEIENCGFELNLELTTLLTPV